MASLRWRPLPDGASTVAAMPPDKRRTWTAPVWFWPFLGVVAVALAIPNALQGNWLNLAANLALIVSSVAGHVTTKRIRRERDSTTETGLRETRG